MGLTLDQEARQVALFMLGAFTKAAAFCGLCQAVATRSYTTSDQVEADEVDLTDRFEILQGLGLPADVHRKLRDLLTATSEVLNDVAVRLPHLDTVDVVLTPASVLAYELYESDDNLQSLVDLNIGDSPLNPLLYHGAAAVLVSSKQ